MATAYWNLNNPLRPISHLQALDLIVQFTTEAEKSFGTLCKTEIEALKHTAMTPDSMDCGFDASEHRDVLLATDEILELTEDVWKKAKHVFVNVRPLENGAPASAWGQIELKGTRPRGAGFYVQPEGEAVRRAMIGKNRSMIAQGGHRPHGY